LPPTIVYFLYSFLLFIAFLILLPRFLFDALRHGKYAAGFWERLGGVPTVDALPGQRVIWLHCVSVGETQAARPVVEELLAAHPDLFLVVSTTTKTGQAIARDLFGKRAGAVIYFPFDWRWTVRRSLARVRPCAVL
jgi:3-deoxy-D-manno-octulosonic-acid transferase